MKKYSDMGLIFLQVFRLFCHWNLYCYLWCRWEKLLPMVSFFLPLVLLPMVQFSNQKQEFFPMVHLAFGAVIVVLAFGAVTTGKGSGWTYAIPTPSWRWFSANFDYIQWLLFSKWVRVQRKLLADLCTQWRLRLDSHWCIRMSQNFASHWKVQDSLSCYACFTRNISLFSVIYFIMLPRINMFKPNY